MLNSEMNCRESCN